MPALRGTVGGNLMLGCHTISRAVTPNVSGSFKRPSRTFVQPEKTFLPLLIKIVYYPSKILLKKFAEPVITGSSHSPIPVIIDIMARIPMVSN